MDNSYSVGSLDARLQEIFTEVTLDFARHFPDAVDLSEACKNKWVDIFHRTIVKGLNEVGVNQWPKRRNYALRHVRKFAELLRRDHPVSAITPEEMEKALQEVSSNTQQALKRLDAKVREFFDSLPDDITDEELRQRVDPLFPFCPGIGNGSE